MSSYESEKKPVSISVSGPIPKDEADEGPRERILLAAQRNFLDQGFELASIREITLQAGVNVAAVNYYYGSKDELLAAVLHRIMQPYTQARIDALCLSEAVSAPDPPPLQAVVQALVRPMVELSRDADGARPLTRLIQQIRARPNQASQRFFTEHLDTAIAKFIDAFQRALPQLSRTDVFWRYNFAIGAIMQVLIDSDPSTHRLKRLSGSLCDTDDDEEIILQLTAFVSAAFLAPSVTR